MKLGIVVGHSKNSPGRVTSFIKEYDLNKELAIAIHERCKKVGINSEIIYRTNGYVALPKDINIINCDYCISVHHNGFDDPDVNGTETLHYHKSKVSRKFARLVNNKMVECLGFRNRDIKAVDSEDRGGYVLKYTKMPCILIEPYFTTNYDAVVNRDTKKLAKYIVDGFKEFLSLQ